MAPLALLLASCSPAAILNATVPADGVVTSATCPTPTARATRWTSTARPAPPRGTPGRVPLRRKLAHRRQGHVPFVALRSPPAAPWSWCRTTGSIPRSSSRPSCRTTPWPSPGPRSMPPGLAPTPGGCSSSAIRQAPTMRRCWRSTRTTSRNRGSPEGLRASSGLPAPTTSCRSPGGHQARVRPVADGPLSQPVTYVDGRNPPLLLLAGSADTTVNPRNTLSLAARSRLLAVRPKPASCPDRPHRPRDSIRAVAARTRPRPRLGVGLRPTPLAQQSQGRGTGPHAPACRQFPLKSGRRRARNAARPSA